jgi:8-oxo-dGTP pyrophosphatase MutT (NUDIX family)
MIVPVTAVDIRFATGNWPVPEALRRQVPAAWARMSAANPHLWDGRVLGVSAPDGGGPPVVEDGVLRGVAREDSFSAFLTWRELGFPEIGVRNLFGSAVIVTADGALIFGVMGETTANAGLVYPPGGSLEPGDVGADGKVDVIASIERELTEETGLDAAEARPGAMVAIYDGPRVSLARLLHFADDSAALTARIRANLDRQEHRELADVVAIRSPADAKAAGPMPPYAQQLAAAFIAGRIP